MWYKNMGTSFFRFVTKHAFDGRKDRQLSWLYRVLHYMQSHGKTRSSSGDEIVNVNCFTTTSDTYYKVQ